jgi:hypothetical protein
MEGLRYAKIGLAVFMTILLPSAYLVRDAGDAVIQAVGLAAFAIGGTVYMVLDMRSERRKKKRSQ